MKLNLRAIDLNLLTIFDAIWEERQMSRAAARLNMTQPAASQALARLRITFDDELFIRSRQGMKPTVRAQALAGPIRSALLQIQQAVTPEQIFDPHTSARKFNIAFARYGELLLFPALLKSIDTYAGALCIYSHNDENNNVCELIKDNDVDIGFDYREPKDNNLRSCVFEYEEMVVIARRGHPRLQKTLTQEDYFRESHVVLSASADLRVFYESIFSGPDARRRILAEAQQAIAIPHLIIDTDSIATIPKSMANSPLFAPHLCVFPLPLAMPPRLPIYMIWHEAMEPDAGHRWLREQLLHCRGR